MTAQPPIQLPAELLDRLSKLLGTELPAFVHAMSRPAVRGLRVNPRKTTPEALAALLGVTLEPVPWCPTGFWLPAEDGLRVGDLPAHRAGMYYLQEPSAMSPAEVLARGLGGNLNGARVIDLAAAPGGKTTRLTELVGPTGIVVANEVDRKRLGILHENLDRWGAANVVTCSRPLDELAAIATGSFDAALLDAPCTGEGMFRRDPETIRHWSVAAVHGSARRQARLLAAAAKLVRPGGVLVYSTCTFAIEENEDRVAALVTADPTWTIEDCTAGFARGVPHAAAPTERSARLWPHRVAGEGHFVALLRRSATALEAEEGPVGPDRSARRARIGQRGGKGHRATDPTPDVKAWREFAAATVPELAERPLVVRGDRFFARPNRAPGLPDDLLTRPGLPLGRARPGRFEPAQALAGLLGADRVTTAREWPADDPRWRAYVTGAEVTDPGADGWVLVCAHGWGVGWARRRGGVLKNFLPPALRDRRAT